MSFRLLCDENVDPAAVPAVEERGFDAIHVTTRPGQSSSDDAVARTASSEDRILVTNDDDFLDRTKYPDLQVFYYLENRLDGHELAERISTVASIVPEEADLPNVMFLTESNLGL